MYEHPFRSEWLRLTCRYAAGDQRLLNPTASAENHVDCRRNAAGDPLLPSGSPWKSKLLLLCLSSKVLADADTLLKISANSNTGKRTSKPETCRCDNGCFMQDIHKNPVSCGNGLEYICHECDSVGQVLT